MIRNLASIVVEYLADMPSVPYTQFSYKNPSDWVGVLAAESEPQMGDLYALCENCADWAGPIIHANAERLDLYGWQLICMNPANWVKDFLSGLNKGEDWSCLCWNSAEWVGSIIKRVHKYNLTALCTNTASWVGPIITEYVSELKWNHWRYICENPSTWAKNILESYPEKIDVYGICKNPANWARDLAASMKGLDIYTLCENKGSWVRDIILAVDELPVCSMHVLCKRRENWAGVIVSANLGRLGRREWRVLCENPAKWAGSIINANLNKMNEWSWEGLCLNRAEWACEILRKHTQHISEYQLQMNPAMWTYSLCAELDIIPEKADKWKNWLEYKDHIIALLTS